MAEFCKECFKKNILTSSDNIADSQLMLSAAWDICEGCGEYKQIVVGIEKTEMSLYNEEQTLINRLKAELQICNEALDNSMKLNTKLQAEIERLKEIEYMYNDLCK